MLSCELSLPRFVSLHSVISWFVAIQKPFYFDMFHNLVMYWNEYIFLIFYRLIACKDDGVRERKETEGRKEVA